MCDDDMMMLVMFEVQCVENERVIVETTFIHLSMAVSMFN